MRGFLRAAWRFLRDGDEHAFTARTCPHRGFDYRRQACLDCLSTSEYLRAVALP